VPGGRVTTYPCYVSRLQALPLKARGLARYEFEQMLEHESMMKQRAIWILDGRYGEEAQRVARLVHKHVKFNKAALLRNLVAAYECACSPIEAQAAWDSLPREQQTTIERMLAHAIRRDRKNAYRNYPQ